MNKSDRIIRDQLVHLILGDQAHMSLEDVVKNFPEKDFNAKPSGLTYSFWHLLEHIRITQQDILDYIQQNNYRELKWPDEYWPKTHTKTDKKGWDNSINMFLKDRSELIRITESRDLYAIIPDSPGHSIFREIVVVGNHNSYHIGEFAILRQVMNNWGKI